MIEAIDDMTNGNAALAIAIATALLLLGLNRALTLATPRLERGPLGANITRQLVSAGRGVLLVGAVIVILWCLELTRARPNLGEALRAVGLTWDIPAGVGLLAFAVMVGASALISLIVHKLRQRAGGGATAGSRVWLPATPSERAVALLVSAPIAGIGEEFVYRGFVMGQIWSLSDNPAVAAALSSIIFGVAHFYQGSWGVIRTALIGLVLAGGVIATGSLFPSMAAHIVLDWIGAISLARRGDSVRERQRTSNKADEA